MTNQPLTAEDRLEIRALIAQGYGSGGIAARTDLDRFVVRAFMLRVGIRPAEPRPGRVFYRCGGQYLVRDYTAAEDALIARMRARGVTVEFICKTLQRRFGYLRSCRSIYNRLSRLRRVPPKRIPHVV